jgi:asparagine synthase (glutamine-hydrolysing)
VVARFGTRHHEVEPRGATLPQLLPRLIWHLDEPTVGPGVFPQFLVCALTAGHGVKVVNGGQGGDELFGGYPQYLQLYLGQQLRALLRDRRPASLVPLVHEAPLAFRQVWSSRRAGVVAGRWYLRLHGASLHPDFAACMSEGVPRVPAALEDPVLNQMYLDLRYYLPALLHVEDRTSMAVSIESRIPFLDYRLVELAAGIPLEDKLRNGELKHQLRRAMRDLLPARVVDRHDKRGFPTPINLWFRRELADWIEQLILSGHLRERRVFEPRYLQRILSAHRRGMLDTSHELWRAANVALWFEQFDARPTW